MLQTHPIAIPSPQQIAPHVFFNMSQQAPRPAAAAQPPAQPQQRAPQPQQPPAPPQPPPPQQQPPQQPQQKAPQQPAQPKAQLDDLAEAFSDTVIKNLNTQLNSTDEATRQSAAMDLCNILQRHPQLAEPLLNGKPSPYKPYVDAFMAKIMKDDAGVRTMGETIMQLGLIKQPSDELRGLIKGLSLKDDANLIKENDIASSILTGLDNGTLGTQVNDLSKKKDGTSGNTANGQNGTGAGGANAAKGAASPDQSGNKAGNQAGNQAGAATGGAGQAAANPADPTGQGNAQPQGGQDASALAQQPQPPQAPQAPQAPDAMGSAAPTPGAASPDSTAGAYPNYGMPGGMAGNLPAVDPYGQAGAQYPGQDAQNSPTSASAQMPPGMGAGFQDPSGGGSALGGVPQNMPGGGQQAGNPAYPSYPSSPSGSGQGSRLNRLSQAVHSYLPSWMQPHTGNKLNLYEGQTS
jgi:hypothetical protein